MNDCIFCKIIKKEAASNTIYEDEKFFSFLDTKPINPGHTLLMPKNHYENLYELPDEILSDIAPLIKKIAVAIKQATEADGINIGMNNDGAAGQIVPHAHFHIIPRFAGDGHKYWQGKSFPKEQSAKMAETIKISFDGY